VDVNDPERIRIGYPAAAVARYPAKDDPAVEREKTIPPRLKKYPSRIKG
jgi:hypothetical protein